jgi:F plasmid transfer operon protein TraF
MRRFAAFLVLCAALAPSAVTAQPFDVIGTKAAGMGGAFVAVADDASAVYWNPGGLAQGAYFSLVLDGGIRHAVPDVGVRGTEHSSYLVAVSMPALGLSYYRLESSFARPDTLLAPADGVARILEGATPIRVDTLTTHHAGVTVVHSVLPSLSVGSTMKLVHGVVSSRLHELATAEEALDADLPQGRGTTKFDIDTGVMLSAGRLKSGLTVRNLLEPDFTTPEGRTLTLDRQVRAGVSYLVFSSLLAAADFDLVEIEDAFGDRRDAAFGLDLQLTRRAALRGGLRFNTAGDDPDLNDRRAYTTGGSFAVTGSVHIDGVVTFGGDQSGRGWGIAARFVY